MRYRVTAQLATEVQSSSGVWTGSKQLPTFELNAGIQGLVSVPHAYQVAREILDPLGIHGDRLMLAVYPA